MLKRKIIILLISMFIFICVFLYGTFQYIDNPNQSGDKAETSELKDAEYKNVWIITGEGTELTFFCEGILRTVKTSVELGEKLEHTFGDIVISDGKIEKITVKPIEITGKITAIEEMTITVQQNGKEDTYSLSDDFKAYRYNSNMGENLEKKQLIKYAKVSLAQEDGKVCAAIADDEVAIDNIRVLINTNNFESVLHDTVTVTCKTKFTITNGSSKTTYKAGKKVTIKPSNKKLSSGNFTIKASNGTGTIQILSIKRNGSYPSYRGTIEVAKYNDKLTVINELPFEEYLYAVIPSEMPTSYNIEALKVQAVCARTYAYNKVIQNDFSEYDADIDDSTQSQVYNNIPEDSMSIKAVKKTEGEILKSGDDILQTYYFSTSWGCTADANDVWIEDSSSALQGELQSIDTKESITSFDFSEETDFDNFLEDTKTETYDSDFPWYRWSVKITAAQLKKTIEKYILERYKENNALILTKNEKGEYESKQISSIGTVEKITVGNRCKSGLINELIVKGSEATIKICSEYNIRLLLAPEEGTIVRNDGSKIDGLSMLPSAFFSVSLKNTTFTFKGGGYGHGVGMSQNGAKAMADDGSDYEAILKHYYSGATIYNLYA